MIRGNFCYNKKGLVNQKIKKQKKICTWSISTSFLKEINILFNTKFLSISKNSMNMIKSHMLWFCTDCCAEGCLANKPETVCYGDKMPAVGRGVYSLSFKRSQRKKCVTVALEDLKTGLGESISGSGSSSKEEEKRIGLQSIFCWPYELYFPTINIMNYTVWCSIHVTMPRAHCELRMMYRYKELGYIYRLDGNRRHGDMSLVEVLCLYWDWNRGHGLDWRCMTSVGLEQRMEHVWETFFSTRKYLQGFFYAEKTIRFTFVSGIIKLLGGLGKRGLFRRALQGANWAGGKPESLEVAQRRASGMRRTQGWSNWGSTAGSGNWPGFWGMGCGNSLGAANGERAAAGGTGIYLYIYHERKESSQDSSFRILKAEHS
ncbi:hypothetical protein VP01_2380g1 [Puccinia sorghi]|uniref:Uncharacterized protein n=1 Tax=Puccinia sorghi TaxID=27349 RepID=A0A0L6V6V5_9BASI|nr:hypothetical protein VP01_2380g1 [Puccinia sorghi]